MKKYLLSLHGSFETKEVCTDIANIITPIVESPHLKFSHRENNLLFCFESSLDPKEIHEFIAQSLSGLFNYFFLSDVLHLSVCMDLETCQHLFDTTNESKNVDIKINHMDEFSRSFEITEEDDDFEDLKELFAELKKQNHKRPSLDQILDKINEKGMKSLTKDEKEILDNFGK